MAPRKIKRTQRADFKEECKRIGAYSVKVTCIEILQPGHDAAFFAGLRILKIGRCLLGYKEEKVPDESFPSIPQIPNGSIPNIEHIGKKISSKPLVNTKIRIGKDHSTMFPVYGYYKIFKNNKTTFVAQYTGN